MTSRAQLLKCSVAIFWVTVASIVTLPTIAFSEAGTFSDVSDINKTTSRYKRTKYMCMISTDDGRKPLPKGMDHFRMSRSHYGVADLYGDGSLDMFFGFSDDTFPIERISESDRKFYEGNEDRSRKNFQYSFYSEVDNFVVPNGTKYLVGRSFAVQDYNSDGVDDYIVAQWGTDYPPQSRRNNEILLSSSSGYISGNLPGGTGYNHSAAAGDIDEDGDVDVVIGQPTTPGRLLFYINDGTGKFSLTSKVGIPTESRDYNASAVSLWDVDGDGYLDLLVSSIDQEGGSFEIAKIFWGKAGTLFDVQPATMSIPESLVKKSEPVVRNGEVMASFPSALDFEFADFLSNSHTDVAVILESGFYSSWTLSIFDVQDRQTSIAYSDQPPAGQQFFIPWISSCDLKKDGDMDIIYEHFGQSFPYGIVNTNAQLDISRLDKLIWESDNGTFKRRLI